MELCKVIIAPDSFKGSMSAQQVADVIGEEIRNLLPDCTIVKMPIADGGEGSLDTILSAAGGKRVEVQVLSPDDRQIKAEFGITEGKAAILEMAQSSGITKQNGLHPMTSSTYGFGQVIFSALEHGAREFILCIGGSATTDGGCGMAAALGARFTNSDGKDFVPCGETLHKIARVDLSALDRRVLESRFTVMCDVTNPLYGKLGAAYIYGPQKGASPEEVEMLDDGLRHFGAILNEQFGRDFADIPGAGAAGGLGAGCLAFLGAKLKSGSEAILNMFAFKEELKDTNLVITGEGKLDSQSFQGKVLSGILQSTGNIPVCSVCGVCTCDEELLRGRGVKAFEASECITAEESLANPAEHLKAAARKAIKYYIGI